MSETNKGVLGGYLTFELSSLTSRIFRSIFVVRHKADKLGSKQCPKESVLSPSTSLATAQLNVRKI